jgi:hypothetical protein
MERSLTVDPDVNRVSPHSNSSLAKTCDTDEWQLPDGGETSMVSWDNVCDCSKDEGVAMVDDDAWSFCTDVACSLHTWSGTEKKTQSVHLNWIGITWNLFPPTTPSSNEIHDTIVLYPQSTQVDNLDKP